MTRRGYLSSVRPTTGSPFMGELMTCNGCGKQRRSDPKVESGWTILELDGRAQYYCPPCFSKLLREHGQLPK